MRKNNELEIVLKIKNNTNFTQPVEIFNVLPNNNFANNSKAIYTWDLSTETYFGSFNVTILISNTSNPTPVFYSIPLNGNNIQSVVDALNSLNQGLFQSNGTTIYVSNDYYVYGALEVVSSTFISTWNTSTTSVGSSASNQIQLPLELGGIYNFIVDWGDGNQDTITTWNQAETLHTYSTPGAYTLNITGILKGFVFNGTGDRNKLKSISNWGTLNLGNSGGYFSGCNDLDLSSVVGILDLSNTISLDSIFSSCTALTTINNVNYWDVSNVNSLSNSFAFCPLFNSDISLWNVNSVYTMNATFLNATSFNQPLNSWNVSNVNNFSSTFFNASAYNQPLNNWNVTNAQLMDGMFQQATAFNQNIGNWNIINVSDFTNFMFGKTNLNYSAANLDAIYNGWSLIAVQPSIVISFGSIKYTLAGQSGKNILLGPPNNWLITDGGI